MHLIKCDVFCVFSPALQDLCPEFLRFSRKWTQPRLLQVQGWKAKLLHSVFFWWCLLPVRLRFPWSQQFYFLSLPWKACRSAYLQLKFTWVCFFFSFLRRREENKVAFGSAESIEEAGLLLWVSSEINLLLLSGQSVMSFLNKKSLLLCQALWFLLCNVYDSRSVCILKAQWSVDTKPQLVDLRCSPSREGTPGCLPVSLAPTHLCATVLTETVSRITWIASLIWKVIK